MLKTNKKLFSLILCVVFLFSITGTAMADPTGDPNIDSGGGTMGEGTEGQNIWNSGNIAAGIYPDEGVRLSVIRITDKAKCGRSVDYTNVTPAPTTFHFGKVSKLEYVQGAPLVREAQTYSFNKPTTPMPQIISSSAGNANLDEIKRFFCDEAIVQEIAEHTGVEFNTLINGEYKLLLEPIAYLTYNSLQYAMTATEAAIYDYSVSGSLSANMGSLTRQNLPLALFLEDDDDLLGLRAWTGSRSGRVDNNDIIGQLGMGIVTFPATLDPPEGEIIYDPWDDPDEDDPIPYDPAGPEPGDPDDPGPGPAPDPGGDVPGHGPDFFPATKDGRTEYTGTAGSDITIPVIVLNTGDNGITDFGAGWSTGEYIRGYNNLSIDTNQSADTPITVTVPSSEQTILIKVNTDGNTPASEENQENNTMTLTVRPSTVPPPPPPGDDGMAPDFFPYTEGGRTVFTGDPGAEITVPVYVKNVGQTDTTNSQAVWTATGDYVATYTSLFVPCQHSVYTPLRLTVPNTEQQIEIWVNPGRNYPASEVNHDNNRLTITIKPNDVAADVQISLSASPGTQEIERRVTLSAVIKNNGPAAARGVIYIGKGSKPSGSSWGLDDVSLDSVFTAVEYSLNPGQSQTITRNTTESVPGNVEYLAMVTVDNVTDPYELNNVDTDIVSYWESTPVPDAIDNPDKPGASIIH